MGSLEIPSPHELRHLLQSATPGLIFPYSTKQQVARIVAGNFTDQARTRIGVDGITIDGPETLDADDAIWCEKGKKGYRVFVSITDISEMISPFSPIDIEALTRATSIYLSPGEIPMIPQALSHDKYSLNGKRKHITLTVAFDISFNGVMRVLPPYESLLSHIGKFTHSEASEILENPDKPHFEQLKLLQEVAALINHTEGRDLGLSGLHEEGIVTSRGSTSQHMRVYKIIETLMVKANRIIANELSGEPLGIFRHHVHPKERAFYAPNTGPHTSLGIHRGGYTHFTSPLRRYADLLAHRLLKYKLRNEQAPFNGEHIQAIIDYINRRIFEIDTIQQYRKNEEAGNRSIDKIRMRHGRNPKAHELKTHIRRTANEPYLLPHTIRSCILDDMQDPDSKNWQWAVGIILLGNDDILKEALWNEVIIKKAMQPLAFLHSLSETRLVLGEEKVFRYHELSDANGCTIMMQLQDGKTLSVKKLFSRKYNANHTRGRARRDLMFKIFRYYSGR